MAKYMIKRCLAVIPVFLAVAFVSFGLVSLYPGDYFTPYLIGIAMMGMDPIAVHSALRMEAGIDKPFIVQSFIWIEGILTEGDFGMSFSGRRVSEILLSSDAGLQWTLVITGCSMVLAWLCGIPLGIISTIRNRKWQDMLISSVAYLGISMPSYTLALLFFYILYKFIDPLMVGKGLWGLVHYELVHEPMSFTKFASYVIHLLPAFVIVGSPMFASIVRYMKSSLSNELPKTYLDTARAKGISELRVIMKHATRNALNPLVSLLGMMLPTLITGSIIASYTLGLPDFGMFFIRAVRGQDQHVLTAALLFYSTFLVVGNLLADLLLVVLDPRIRYE